MRIAGNCVTLRRSRCYVIIDRAGWHLFHRQASRIPSKQCIMVIVLGHGQERPKELNPVENIWQFMRDN